MNSNKKINNPLDLKLSIALMASFVVLTFQYLLLISFSIIGTPVGSLIQIISKLIVAVFYIYAFPTMWKRAGKLFLIVYFISILILFTHYLLYAFNRPFLVDLIFPIFFISLPAFTYSLAIRDFDIFQIVTKYAAILVFIFGVIISLFIFSGNSTFGVYSISLSYYMLLPALIFLGDFFEKYRFSSGFLFTITFLIIISLGSRGALLGVIVFILFSVLRFNKEISRKAVFIRFVCFFLFLILIFQYSYFLAWLNSKLSTLGISSRTLILFQENEIHLSGRENLYSQVINEILKHPFIGIGIAGDRQKINGYSHNIFLEILSNYGVLIGLSVIIVLLFLILKALVIKEIKYYNLVTMWLSLGFIHLIVSGSYLTDLKFWIFLGLIINILFFRDNKKALFNENKNYIKGEI